MKRFLAAFMAVGLAGPLSSAAHQALVPHAVCALHGELVDAAPGSPADSGAGVHGRADSLPDPHEHCAAAHARAAELPATTLLAAPVIPALSSRLGLLPAHRGIALLRLAPKTSPPV